MIVIFDDHLEAGIWTARLPFIIVIISTCPVFYFTNYTNPDKRHTMEKEIKTKNKIKQNTSTSKLALKTKLYSICLFHIFTGLGGAFKAVSHSERHRDETILLFPSLRLEVVVPVSRHSRHRPFFVFSGKGGKKKKSPARFASRQASQIQVCPYY